MRNENDRLKAFFGVWYASEKLDDIADFVHQSEKQKIKNISKEFFRIESRSFKAVKPDAEMANAILMTNEAFDKVIDLFQSKDKDKIQLVFDVLGMDYKIN